LKRKPVRSVGTVDELSEVLIACLPYEL